MNPRLLLFPLLALCLPAFAGRPLSTEDATTLDDGDCQLEAWANRTRANTTEAVAVPACAFLGIEAQLGTGWVRESGEKKLSAQFFQLKHAFRKVDDGEWGIAFVAGLARNRTRETASDWGDPYFIVPLSFGPGEDKDTRWLFHLNLGTTRNREEGRNLTLWGVAFEKPVTQHLTLLAEAFGENTRDPFYRAGGRYTVIPNHLDIDFTYVGRSGGAKEDRLWSLGFHLEGSVFK
jgi:hypothetical protein